MRPAPGAVQGSIARRPLGLATRRAATGALIAIAVALVPRQAAAESTWFEGERGVAAVVEGGPSYRHFYDLHVAAGDVDVGIGTHTEAGALFGRIGTMAGRTASGVLLVQPRGSVSWEAPLGAGLRLGVAVQIGAMLYQRATSEALEVSPALGPRLLFSYELFRTQSKTRVALFTGLRGGADVVGMGDDEDLSAVPDVSLTLGARFF